MLNWLAKLFLRRHEDPPQRRPTSPVRVASDEKTISIDDGAGGVASIAWADIASVTVTTTDLGPFETDLFWILTEHNGRQVVAIPMGAAGEQELLQAMQARLAGFDNMAVVEAMSSISPGVFQIWPAEEIA